MSRVPDTRAVLPEERLALALRDLPAAPSAWVEAAALGPEIRRALAEIDARVLAGADDRAQETQALEAALRAVQVPPTQAHIEHLRRLVARRPAAPGDAG